MTACPRPSRRLALLFSLLGPVALAPAQPPAAEPPLDWAALEDGVLGRHVQLTFADQFLRAGEQYFDPTMTWIVFQAVPMPAEGEAADQFYSMYVAKLVRDSDDDIVAIERPIRLSPPGSSNTCGWFHPKEPWRVIFGSTITPPSVEEQPGYQRGTSRYVWQFPREMEIATTTVRQIWDSFHPRQWSSDERPGPTPAPTPLFENDGYDAECAYSPCGRYIVYGSLVDAVTEDLDLFIYDATTERSTKVVEAPGYDGGPFFSPDGKRICYRSDRNGDDLLQLFVADLEFDEDGGVIGVSREHQLTDNGHVNWAPFWHPSGEFLVYTTSEVGHRNYEVFSIRAPSRGESIPPEDLTPRRVTHASGFDGLPVFSPDGEWMLWTSQRGPALEGQTRPTSQVWAARVGDLRPE